MQTREAPAAHPPLSPNSAAELNAPGQFCWTSSEEILQFDLAKARPRAPLRPPPSSLPAAPRVRPRLTGPAFDRSRF